MIKLYLKRISKELNNIKRLYSKNNISFSKEEFGAFYQEPPFLYNSFLNDVTLRKYLLRNTKEIYNEIEADLDNFACKITSEIHAQHVVLHNSTPRLNTYNSWGKRIDELVMSPAWKQMKDFSAIEGLVALPYENKYAEYSRIFQMSKLYLYSPSSGLYTCPLAMTDGAAKTIKKMKKTNELFQNRFKNLTSRDPKKFMTSGQWMTERKGGSDVGNGTETLAVLQSDGSYKLYGYKWFTSAIDADMSFTLARIVDGENLNTNSGSKGISMFFVDMRNSDGNLNNIQVIRLKDKLGTRQMPTAELLLDGTTSYLASDIGKGIQAISDMLTITRWHNSISAVGAMRRIVNLAIDYSRKRICFGKTIMNYPLHAKTLFNLELECRGTLLLVLDLSRLLGLEENNKISRMDADILRLLTPIAKLYTAKQAMSVISEGLECFGGIGYLEDSGLPLMLRDAQVLPIWEGTTNILSLDVLRAIDKSNLQVVISMQDIIIQKLNMMHNQFRDQKLKEAAIKVKYSINEIVNFIINNHDILDVSARNLSFSIAKTYIGMLMLEHALYEDNQQDTFVAISWCRNNMAEVVKMNSLKLFSKETTDIEKSILFQ